MDPILGEIRLFGFNFAPRGWALAQGQSIGVNQNTALFALYGTFYGGNGQTTFNLPDLRGRIPIGQGPRPGGQTWTMGQQAGTENTTLTTANIPPHVHAFTGTLSASDVKATENTPVANGTLGRSNDNSGGTGTPVIYTPAGTAATIALAGVSGTTQPTGNGLPVSILPPVLGLNYSVAIQGVFPSRN